MFVLTVIRRCEFVLDQALLKCLPAATTSAATRLAVRKSTAISENLEAKVAGDRAEHRDYIVFIRRRECKSPEVKGPSLPVSQRPLAFRGWHIIRRNLRDLSL